MTVPPVDPNICRSTDCPNPPKWVGTWQYGEEKGWRIPYCADCGNEGQPHAGWTDVTPWFGRTLEEIEAEFWKELNS